ncbi:hypothetical protein OEZ49_15545 [Ruegeria sp. WL0004]|uniref:Peptidase M23 n=1 Tax=Ruegeria marisflavi TaxID=2984152 RepID=A0ABT2WTG6_9RHOB|nr:hypothetical protein [Ruegeria sp. WL0004]MCU9839189.1 hypothetical protein [Ruegeria sp. WL0004]
MKTMLFLPLTLIAAPAFAHDGFHLHPHGSGDWLAVSLGLIACGLALLVWLKANR